MKRIVITTANRIARLKLRLGIPTRTWSVRVKRGGLLTITPPMMQSLGLNTGDVIAWDWMPRGLVGLRVHSFSEWRLSVKSTRSFPRLWKDESLLCDYLPSFRLRQSDRKRPLGRPDKEFTTPKISLHLAK